jgi:lysyl-tRNA synthetase class 2
VETPVRIEAPAPEPHIDPFESQGHYLRTSPEFHMKRLLAAGYPRLYQVGPCFRSGERGAVHHPEYAMLEWYRAGADYLDILADTKALVVHVAREVLGTTDLVYQGAGLALWPVWETFRVAEAFREFAGWDPSTGFDQDRFDLDLTRRVEPRLPRHVPVVLLDYPLEVAALARAKPDAPRLAERWELYLAGLEMANAYSELTDPEELQARFHVWARQRHQRGCTRLPPDRRFLEAMESGLPASGGIAMGLDRLLMILCNAASLDEVLPFRD